MITEYWGIVTTLVATTVTGVIVLYSWRRLPALSVAMIAWFVVAFAASQRGFFQNTLSWTEGDIFGFLTFGVLMCIPLLIFFVAQGRSATFRRFVNEIPMPALIGIEVYRILGVVFLWFFTQEKIPAVLGTSTGISDLVIGVTALPLAWAFIKRLPNVRRLAIAWNIFGISDFLIAMSIISLSFLGLLQLHPDPVMIGFHPLALISLFQLPLSIIIHALALQRLLMPIGNPKIQHA